MPRARSSALPSASDRAVVLIHTVKPRTLSSTETVVTDDSARRLFDIEPAPFERTLREALVEDGVIAAAQRS